MALVVYEWCLGLIQALSTAAPHHVFDISHRSPQRAILVSMVVSATFTSALAAIKHSQCCRWCSCMAPPMACSLYFAAVTPRPDGRYQLSILLRGDRLERYTKSKLRYVTLEGAFAVSEPRHGNVVTHLSSEESLRRVLGVESVHAVPRS